MKSCLKAKFSIIKQARVDANSNFLTVIAPDAFSLLPDFGLVTIKWKSQSVHTEWALHNRTRVRHEKFTFPATDSTLTSSF